MFTIQCTNDDGGRAVAMAMLEFDLLQHVKLVKLSEKSPVIFRIVILFVIIMQWYKEICDTQQHSNL